MGFQQDLAAAQALYDKEQAEFNVAKAERDAAKAALDTLLVQAVKGGPDVSQHQGAVDFTQVAGAGYELAIQRIAEGDVLDDFWTPTRINAIRAAGLILGSYYFARVANPGNGQRNGKSEAAMAVYFAESRGALKPGDLPLAYDFEGGSIQGQTPQKCAKHVMEFLRAYHYLKGTPPMLYSNPSTWETIRPHLSADDLAFVGTCPLWVAHYGVTQPTVPVPWSGWTLWQYTDTGSGPGVAGNADINRFGHDKAALQALRIQPV
jgi:GH25 family lysozyme M1 (1,4-beta-N-acetylmuramidase)